MENSTKGVLVFARNNAQIDYVKQAYFLAKQLKKFCKLPTSLVTDALEYVKTFDDYANVFDNIINIDYDPKNDKHHIKTYHDGRNYYKRLEFKNNIRSLAYDMSPYDSTLLLDTDIVVLDDTYIHCFEQNHDFLIYDESFDLAGFRNYSEFEYINVIGVKFYWATAVFFKKTNKNRIFFNLVRHIQDNWNHYRSVFQIGPALFRNDHAFSIAIHIMNGYQNGPFANKMPGKLFYTLDKDICWEIKDNSITFLLEKENHFGEFTLCKWQGHNIHVMNKYSLNRCIDKVLNE
tara:strand:- start:849 stop:1718 length:870 start_codon:yes stop_codon:yes gene_type:complete